MNRQRMVIKKEREKEGGGGRTRTNNPLGPYRLLGLLQLSYRKIHSKTLKIERKHRELFFFQTCFKEIVGQELCALYINAKMDMCLGVKCSQSVHRIYICNEAPFWKSYMLFDGRSQQKKNQFADHYYRVCTNENE